MSPDPTPVPREATLFETPRLRCRRWLARDLDAIYAIYADPVAMRWVGDGEPITRSGCDEWFEVTQRNYARRGYGMFVLEDKASGAIVGCCGLVHPGDQTEAEIKYALLRSQWGRGLASEAVPALLAHGARAYGLQHVIATVAPDNLASQRVLAKAGMALAQRRENGDGSQTLVFDWRPG